MYRSARLCSKIILMYSCMSLTGCLVLAQAAGVLTGLKERVLQSCKSLAG